MVVAVGGEGSRCDATIKEKNRNNNPLLVSHQLRCVQWLRLSGVNVMHSVMVEAVCTLFVRRRRCHFRKKSGCQPFGQEEKWNIFFSPGGRALHGP